jgi:hypothetical protein
LHHFVYTAAFLVYISRSGYLLSVQAAMSLINPYGYLKKDLSQAEPTTAIITWLFEKVKRFRAGAQPAGAEKDNTG